MQWTPNGDAFIIGSDLRRLESETLPLYFRHNRFQSLVRQLNFYSFRKINRERNVWVYKHPLFHREKPEDLKFVKRRSTCTTADGRKQRISRVSSEKLRSEASDDSSVEMPPMPSPYQKNAKRVSEESFESSPNKRQRKDSPGKWNEESLLPVSLDGDDDDVTYGTRSRRSDSVEQSLAVSEVASQLEKYTKHSSKGRSTRRSGIVTPPYQASLLTYDDEFMAHENIEDCFSSKTRRISLEGDHSAPKVESDAVIKKTVVPTVSPNKPLENSDAPPVRDCSTVESVLRRMMASVSEASKTKFISDAAVVGFCMSTAPCGDEALCDKISDLLSSCDPLEKDFRLYRSALGLGEHDALISKSSANLGPSLRDFKTFAFNCLQGVLAMDGTSLQLTTSDKEILEKTTTTWLRCM